MQAKPEKDFDLYQSKAKQWIAMQVRSTVCSMHFKQIDYRQVKIAHPAQNQEKRRLNKAPLCMWHPSILQLDHHHMKKKMHKKGDQIDPP